MKKRGSTKLGLDVSLKDTDNITLLYPSDYTYTYANEVDNICYNSGYFCYAENAVAGWLYKSEYDWRLVSSHPDNPNDSFVVGNNGAVQTGEVSSYFGVRLVVYLKSSVKLDGGTGTSSDPYKLKI